MESSTPTQSAPPRLLVSSPTEATKIREYATAWREFERSVARFRKTKRWQVVQARTNDLLNAVVARAQVCLEAWAAWQTARTVRHYTDMIVEHKLPKAPPASIYFEGACCALKERRPSDRQLWVRALRIALMFGDSPEHSETALLVAAQPVAAFVEQAIKSYMTKKCRPGHPDYLERVVCRTVATFAKLDVGQFASHVFPFFAPELHNPDVTAEQFAPVISDEGLEKLHAAFARTWGELNGLNVLFDAQLERRNDILEARETAITDPAPDWAEAGFFKWLYDVSLTRLDDTLWGKHKVPATLDVPVEELLRAPLCWQLWLHERWPASSAPDQTLDEPRRTVLCQLVESPARFLRFPNPAPAVADLRRMLRPLAALLEGFQAHAERARLAAAIRQPGAGRSELVHLLAIHCAHRWATPLAPHLKARFVSLFDTFLREDIVPQAPEILRDWPVALGGALPTSFESEFERLLLAEEAHQAQIDAELAAHRESWRPRPFSHDAFAPDADLAPASRPITLRYLFNLGEPQPRELRLATSGATLMEDLEQFCQQHDIAVCIPFSSVAHAIEHYLFDTPAEAKFVWPERETYGPLELHKIKRGGMRLLVRESTAGLWLHLLQRRDWFLGQPA